MCGQAYELSEARLDWITCFQRPRLGISSLRALGHHGVQDEVEHGARLADFRFQGFIGEQAGRWAWGARSDGVICRVSGAAADGWAASLATLADHWSRADYCVTAIAPDASEDPTLAAYQAGVDHESARARPVELTRWQSSKSGSTLYLGRRASPYFARLYDKHHESKGVYPVGAWRWEIELKGHASEYEQTRRRESNLSLQAVAAMVASEFARRGIIVPWRSDVEVERAIDVRPPSDLERSTLWLQSQVAKTAQWVARERGVDEVLRALGLADLRDGGGTH